MREANGRAITIAQCGMHWYGSTLCNDCAVAVLNKVYSTDISINKNCSSHHFQLNGF